MKQIEIRPNGTKRVITINNEPSLTQQHHKDECDVNKIIAKYKKTGHITHLARDAGMYADLSGKTDYMSAMETVLKARDAFMTLPSEARRRFQNDPAELLAFLENPANREEAIKLGLIDKPSKNAAEPEPQAAPEKPSSSSSPPKG